MHGTMNFTKLLICGLVCAVCVFAQEPDTLENSFDKLHGFAYPKTLGGAPTIADLVATPSNILGHKFVYVSPADYLYYLDLKKEMFGMK